MKTLIRGGNSTCETTNSRFDRNMKRIVFPITVQNHNLNKEESPLKPSKKEKKKKNPI